ncbi:MAG: hypothetical protein LBK56_07005 [Gracilibacteraceae bacterium]|nr:hypothetical protein [Gracilibacteraceae bacterium]
MIIYVSELRPDLLDEICGKLFMIVTKIRQSHLKKLVIGSAADFSHAGRFVVDLSALKDTTGEFIEAIAAFRAMYTDTRVIVVADRETPGSLLFARLIEMGVYDIARDPGDDALKKCLTTGMTQEEARAVLMPDSPLPPPGRGESSPEHAPPMPGPPCANEKLTANRDFKKHKQFVTVAVCGAEPHIGATHHALLATKFLCGTGFKACYLEAGERRNIVYLARAYAVNANERRHLLQFEGVDMYFDFKLPEVVSAGYDFLIFDFGRFSELESASFLAKDIKLVVGGAKAWEMPAYSSVFEAVADCRNVQFIMNHAPPGEQAGIRSLMGGCKTHFADYAPYPFATGANLGMYKEIFRDYLTIEQVKPPAETKRAGKKRFFGLR